MSYVFSFPHTFSNPCHLFPLFSPSIMTDNINMYSNDGKTKKRVVRRG